MTRDVVLLGSTGSIGTQAIDVVRAAPDRFRVVGLAAGGGRPELLAAQALELGVAVVGVAKPAALEDVQLALYAEAQRRGYSRGDFAMPRLLAGSSAAEEVAAWPCDVVVNGMTGSLGLAPTLAAIDAGRTLALANKESLIAGGPLVKARAKPGQIIPVDSEHSAIAQCLRSGTPNEVRRLVLTASGGPFRGTPRSELGHVTVAQALAHPTWDMGPVVTINCATLVNKGLELIEAHWLFDVGFDAIDVVVHPQSVIHSMVEFVDGSTIAQASPPDMHLPIALALAWPERVDGAASAFDWTTPASWTFEPLDNEAFPAVELAKAAGKSGGTTPAVFNAANEEAVEAFVAGRLPFVDIVDTVAAVVASHETLMNITTLADVQDAEDWARGQVHERIAKGTSA
ncbi:MAG TPA: 1-deoxy-D-xylulose-5-phosphate reductoisomerase [Mycobacteriales bacterium]|jgi:1-deoxy-D-xylulose-5-phosphate reductoisomerase|nr:1-deoxy-D-xylulose-5-phosphate reductoisomerase [Mycobacteriales bacterium]